MALAGGTGGAKLAHGLQAVLPPGDLTVIVNTGDDTERHGLLVMPDHDAVMYMLAGRFDHERGWGLAGETWSVMDALAEYGEETWFRLGDRDFATHIARTARLREDRALTSVVLSLQEALGIPTRILPMADDPVRTQVRTDEGWLDFQEYFVHLRQQPEVREVRFTGDLTATPQALDALDAAEAIVIGPSNPIVSIGPILAGPIAARVAQRAQAGISVVAVTPIVGGVALKGRRTGCSSRSATDRAPGEWPGSTATSPQPSCSTAWTPRSSRTSPGSGCGPSSPTRSWPTMRVGRESPGPCWD